MPLVNHTNREIHLKIVYYGPPSSGKKTNLELIHAHTIPEHRSNLIRVVFGPGTVVGLELLSGGMFKDYRIRLHLCTLTGRLTQERVRQLILRHADGVVFVVDSRMSKLGDDCESISSLAEDMRAERLDSATLPLVVQYNKRDLSDALDVVELRRHLSVPAGVPEIEAVAIRGDAVFDTMKAIVRICLKGLGHPEKAREGRSPSIIPPGIGASLFPRAPRPDTSEDAHLTGASPLPRPPLLPS